MDDGALEAYLIIVCSRTRSDSNCTNGVLQTLQRQQISMKPLQSHPLERSSFLPPFAWSAGVVYSPAQHMYAAMLSDMKSINAFVI
jgi:hypothetical protein